MTPKGEQPMPATNGDFRKALDLAVTDLEEGTIVHQGGCYTFFRHDEAPALLRRMIAAANSQGAAARAVWPPAGERQDRCLSDRHHPHLRTGRQRPALAMTTPMTVCWIKRLLITARCRGWLSATTIDAAFERWPALRHA